MSNNEAAKIVPLRETDQWFRNSLEQCPLGVAIVSDVAFERLFANEACARLFGANSREEFTAQSIDNSFVDQVDLDNTRAALVRGEDIVSMECRRYRNDGSITWMASYSSKTVFDGKKAHIFWMRDISERKSSEVQTQTQLTELQAREKLLEEQALALSESTKSLSRAHSELEKLNREKDNFLSIVAHDLRSPFTGLLGATEVLAHLSDRLSPDDIAEYAVSLHKTTKGVYDFLESLLDWAELQKGQVSFTPTPYLVQESIQSGLAELGSLIDDKNIVQKTHHHTTRRVLADKTMIDKVCRNLLSNAIKFTPARGEIEIHTADDGPDVTVAIQDTGTGISDQITEGLFRLDKKTATRGTFGETGSGMGLILCKEMIERQGGRIKVFSEQGKGTTCQFWLPAAE